LLSDDCSVGYMMLSFSQLLPAISKCLESPLTSGFHFQRQELEWRSWHRKHIQSASRTYLLCMNLFRLLC